MSEEDFERGGQRRLRVTPGVVIWGLLALSTFVLLTQNSADTVIQFFWLEITAPLFVVIGAALLLGWGIGELGTRIWSWRRRDRDDH